MTVELTTGRRTDLPYGERLLVSYEGATTSIFELKAAATDLCHIVWLADLSEPGMAERARLLRRLGTVVDICGLSVGEMIEELGGLQPSGILTMTDRRMVDLAEIAEALGLRFHSPEAAARVADKFEQRQALRGAGLRVPPYWSIPTGLDADEAARVADTIRYPAVLKPRCGAGSRGVHRVKGPAELAAVVGPTGRPLADESGWMAEGVLDGAEPPVTSYADVLSVESMIVDGRVHHLAITGRFPLAEPFRETGSVLPSDVSAADAAAARRVAEAAISGLGLVHGCTHTEVKFTPDGPSVIEVNGRIGGGIAPLLALAGAEIDLVRVAMELALGRQPSVRLPLEFSRVAYRRLIMPPVTAGRIVAMSGHEAVAELPGVEELTVNRQPGDRVNWRLGLPDFVISVYGSADSHQAVHDRSDRIDELVRVEYEDGNDTGDEPVGTVAGRRRP